jgi:hypothetical protein
LLCQYVPSAEESPSRLADWVLSVFTVFEAMYSEMSLRGLFHVGNGEFSKMLLIALSPLLATTYYPRHQELISQCVHDHQSSIGTSITRNYGRRALQYPSHITVESFTSDSLTLLMTLLGQLCYDLYAFPLCMYYCKNKTDTLSGNVDLKAFPFLLAFIRFCDDDMGVHAAASRMAYNFLYSSISEVMYPAKHFASVASCEESILQALCDIHGDSNSLIDILTQNNEDLGTDNAMHDVFRDFYDGLLKCGLMDASFAIASFPKRPYDSIEPSSQTYEPHPFFYQNADEIKNHAHLHLYLSHLSLYPGDIDVWFRMHDRLHELVCLCLDDIGFNIYSPRNVSSAIKSLAMGSIGSMVRVLCGTMTAQADVIYNETLDIMRVSGLMEVVSNSKVSWWDEHHSPISSPDTIHNCECECESVAIKRSFVSCLDGIPADYEDLKERPGALSSLVGIGLVFAKLNALVHMSKKVVAVIHKLLVCDEDAIRRCDSCSVPSDFAQRYSMLCEQRCLSLLTAAKLYPPEATEYVELMHEAYLAACAGRYYVKRPSIHTVCMLQ